MISLDVSGNMLGRKAEQVASAVRQATDGRPFKLISVILSGNQLSEATKNYIR